MARVRSHARRRKTRLTSQTLSAVMDVGPRAEETLSPETSALDLAEINILELLTAEPDDVSVPSVYNDAASVFRGASDFPAERFVLGLSKCSECRNEMIYYQDRDRLANGFTFRCRVCQHAIQVAPT